MSRLCKLEKLKRLLKDKPLTTLEIKEFVNTSTKYGATTAAIGAYMRSNSQDFVKVGVSMVRKESGSYKVDLWWLRELKAIGENAISKPVVQPNPVKIDNEDSIIMDMDNNMEIIEPEPEPEPILEAVGELSFEEDEEPEPDFKKDIYMLSDNGKKNRMIWTDDLKREFIKYRRGRGLTQIAIAKIMGLRLTQVKGAQKDYKAGLYDYLIN